MRTSKVQSTVTRRAALTGVGAGGLGIAFALRPAAAQDATPVATEGHPLVGTWTVPINGPNAPVGPALITYSADGIVTQLDPFRGNASGVWEAQGPRSGLITLVFLDYPSGTLTDFNFGVA